MGRIWRFKWRRTKRFWVGRWWLNQKIKPCRWVRTTPAKTLPNHTHDFPKTIMVKKGTCAFLHQCMRQPRNRQKLFPENKNTHFGDIRMCKSRRRQPRNRETLFSENKNPRFGYCCTQFLPFFAIWCDFDIFYVKLFKTIYDLMKMSPKKFRNLPSAARFFPKGFRHIDFWTFILSIFWKFYRVLQSKNKK